MCSGGTIFPEGLALGSTWNLDLVGEVYAAAAREARAIGVHQIFTLVVEPIRDPRLGRNQEGYSRGPLARAPASPRRSCARCRATTSPPPTRWSPACATTRARASR